MKPIDPTILALPLKIDDVGGICDAKDELVLFDGAENFDDGQRQSEAVVAAVNAHNALLAACEAGRDYQLTVKMAHQRIAAGQPISGEESMKIATDSANAYQKWVDATVAIFGELP